MPVVSLSHLSDKGMYVISYGILRLYASVEVMWRLHLASLSDFDQCKEKGCFLSDWIVNMILVSGENRNRKRSSLSWYEYQAYSSFNLQHDWIISVYL